MQTQICRSICWRPSGSPLSRDVHNVVLPQANAGPNTNGSQFFLSLAPTPWLDGKHTIFGRVYSGMETLERLGNMQTDATDRPVNQIKILSARPL